jgi:hypothetical protein
MLIQKLRSFCPSGYCLCHEYLHKSVILSRRLEVSKVCICSSASSLIVLNTGCELGFYGVSYYVGFQDKFKVQNDEIMNRICELEIQADPRQSAGVVEEIRKVMRAATHMWVFIARRISSVDWTVATASLIIT